ncbi:hypothetical protein SteCoe_24183 [Stentor coeruleus]|uniref:Kelch motif family protein n=1 Tax=Stentor coeruleus TaxID=5963 RepID=A0A1R2BI78_9CILI|nr:hypothetical protein SteCoe_24183 [Stentor coeruleus]
MDYIPSVQQYNKSPQPSNFYSGYSPVPRNPNLSRVGGNIINSSNDLNSFTLTKRFLQGSQSVRKLNSPHINSNPNNFANSSKVVPSNRSIFNSSSPVKLGYESVDKPSYNLNPIVTSNNYREKQLMLIQPPKDKIKAIFAIYYLGFGYDSSSRSFGKPNGLGFLLNENLCMTAHSVIPDEKSASASYAQFHDGQVFKFDPKRCFVTSSNYEFTLLAFQHQSETVLKHFKPIHITELFDFHRDDSVNYFPLDAYELKKVMDIDKNSFTFASGRKENLFPGTGVFNNHWVLQGMYVRNSSFINIAIRMTPILKFLESYLSLKHNDLLDKFLHLDHMAYLEKFHDRYLYYFEWHGKNIWRYDIDKSQWDNITLRNLEQMETENPLWTFHWNSRLIYLPNASILIIGGKSKDTGNECKDVWMFSPEKYNTLSRYSNMLTARESPACVYVEKFVYILGGKPGLNSCERLSLASKKWQSIAPMYYVRHDATACTALDANYIFVFGGMPLNHTGNTIERYSFKGNEWELLTVLLPRSFARLCVFPVTNRKIAILGGTSSNLVFILYIEDNVGDLGTGHDCNYRIEECLNNLNEITETVYPVAFSRKHNRLFLLNCARSGYNGLTPGVVDFQMENLDNPEDGEVENMSKNLGMVNSLDRRGVRTPYDMQRYAG